MGLGSVRWPHQIHIACLHVSPMVSIVQPFLTPEAALTEASHIGTAYAGISQPHVEYCGIISAKTSTLSCRSRQYDRSVSTTSS